MTVAWQRGINVAQDFTDQELEILNETHALHEEVKQAVRREALAQSPNMEGIKERLIELRDQAITANAHDLPALFQALYTHHSLAARSFDKRLPDMRAPYFGHIRLQEGHRIRDVLIGYQTFIDSKSDVTIIDWRHAALAKVFFNYREGDEYEIELPGRIAEGRMLLRRIITFDTGELVGVEGPSFNFSRVRGGIWHKVTATATADLAGGAGQAVNINQFNVLENKRRLPDVSALLDREQYEILTKEQDALLVLGGAGSGKTTIALHRLAHLAYQKPRFYQPSSMMVVVPEQGLVRLTQRLLRGLGMAAVGVSTFDEWVKAQGKRILKGIPKKLYDSASSQVIFMKRHGAMSALLDHYLRNKSEDIAQKLDSLFGSEVSRIFQEAAGGFLWSRLAEAERYCRSNWVEQAADPDALVYRRGVVDGFFTRQKQLLNNVDMVRSEIYTNPELLDTLISASQGEINLKMTQLLREHTRRQFEERFTDKFTGEEKERDSFKTVDGADIEEDDYAGTIDIEDYAVLLVYLQKLSGKVGRKGQSLTNYSHLVIDEAQDLAPLELMLLGQTLGDKSTVTVAGDAAQQSDSTVVFRGWDDAMQQLGLLDVEETRLTTNYRCPRPIAEFGHKILGAAAPAEMPRSIREGRPVTISHYPNEGLAFLALIEALERLTSKELLASVAVVAENEESALRVYKGLAHLGDVRLVLDGEFSFRPGIDVTDVAQVKGLEFDYVIIPDANLATYPDTLVARRTLHIAVTRAVHQLWVVSVGRLSDIIAPLQIS